MRVFRVAFTVTGLEWAKLNRHLPNHEQRTESHVEGGSSAGGINKV